MDSMELKWQSVYWQGRFARFLIALRDHSIIFNRIYYVLLKRVSNSPLLSWSPCPKVIKKHVIYTNIELQCKLSVFSLWNLKGHL